jgi:hypothetical protein
MEKGNVYYSKLTSSIWDIKKGEKLTIKGKPVFGNGEYQVKTNKGYIPTVFLTETIEDEN